MGEEAPDVKIGEDVRARMDEGRVSVSGTGEAGTNQKINNERSTIRP
jgi:hypothetical protein